MPGLKYTPTGWSSEPHIRTPTLFMQGVAIKRQEPNADPCFCEQGRAEMHSVTTYGCRCENGDPANCTR